MNVYYKGNVVSIGTGNKPLEGLKLCIIGDSNIQYGSAILEENLLALTGCASLKNMGYAGATWATTEGKDTTNGTSAVGRVNQLINPYIGAGLSKEYDIVIIMMGTNDEEENAGTVDSSSDDVSVMAGAMHYCLQKLLYYFRESMIVGVIPPQSEYYKKRPERFKVIEEIYDYYSIPCLDFWGSGQVVWNQKTENNVCSYLGDGIHLGTNGRNQFCHKLARFLESVY